MALSVSCRVGTKIPVPSVAGHGRSRSSQLHPGFLRPAWMRDCRDECSTRPYPRNMYGTSQGVDLVFNGHTQGSHGDPCIQAVPVSQEEALLGKPLLGQGLLRR